MATYRINVPTTGGTITAATFNTSCVNNVNIDFTSDPDQMIRSTGVTSDGKVTIDCYADNTPTSRDWEFPLTYKSGSNYCGHTLHLYQEGSGGEVESHRIYIDVSTLVSGLSNYKLYFTDVAPNVSLHAVSLLKEDGEYFATNSTVSGGKVNLALLTVERNGSNCTYVSDEMSHGEIWFNVWTGYEYSHGDIPHNTSIYVVLVPNNYDEVTNPGFRLCTAVTLNENNVTCGDYTITVDNCAY